MDSGESGAARPTVVDLGFRLAYRTAYQLMKTYWKVRRPTTHGTLVALWNQGEVLLVKNSYVGYYSLPGGYLHSGEQSRDAAVRELKEEIGLAVRPDQLEPALDVTQNWEGKIDRVEIWNLDTETRPPVHVDNREVIEAGWFTRERALKLNLYPPLRRVIEERGA
jgi:8-oxo-dGTP diphosphatase